MNTWIILLLLVLMFGGLFVVDFFIIRYMKNIEKKMNRDLNNINFDFTKLQKDLNLLYEYSFKKDEKVVNSKFEEFLIKTINKIISFFDKFLTKYKLM